MKIVKVDDKPLMINLGIADTWLYNNDGSVVQFMSMDNMRHLI
jgi:hypothetical protein